MKSYTFSIFRYVEDDNNIGQNVNELYDKIDEIFASIVSRGRIVSVLSYYRIVVLSYYRIVLASFINDAMVFYPYYGSVFHSHSH